LSLATSSGTLSEITVVFSHSGLVIVVETTYFGIEFILLAKPCSSSIVGQASANPW
jgi:hypothetical protein